MTPQTSDSPTPETMRFGRGEAVLGTIVLAASANGVAALFIGGDHTTPLRDLKEAFPDIGFVLDQEGLAETIAKAVALVDASYLGTDLVLDMRGSPVEMAVWDALCAVPPGETRTYSAIAGHLPIAATAQDVAAACAASRIAVAVPCHRVVKSDGSISGCRWGVQRKRRLINMEEVA